MSKMITFRFSWTEEWEAFVEAESFEKAQELFDDYDRENMGFCGRSTTKVELSESDMSALTGFDGTADWRQQSANQIDRAMDILLDSKANRYEQVDENELSSALMDMYDLRNALSLAIKNSPKDEDGTEITIGDCLDSVIETLEKLDTAKGGE